MYQVLNLHRSFVILHRPCGVEFWHFNFSEEQQTSKRSQGEVRGTCKGTMLQEHSEKWKQSSAN